MVYSSVEHGIETHISSKPRVSFRDTKSIDLPTYLGFRGLDLFDDELMSSHEVVNQIFIVCTSLIWRTPASIDQVKLAIMDELAHLLPFGLILLVQPHFEELHLSVGESSIAVFLELLEDCGENIGDVTHIPGHLGIAKVILQCI